MPASAPVNEIGYAQAPNYNWWLYDEETTPELIWPQSVAVYEAMRTQDAQVASVLRAVTLPVRRTPWRIDPAGARPEVAQFVADDLSLPIVGRNPSPPPRTRDRFSWPEHLRQALLMLPFGHMYFEIVFRVSEDGARAHLRKLAPRMPKTIERIEVADDGGLISIKQWWTRTDAQPKPIPVDRLVAYVHDREGGNWLGRALAVDTPVPTPDGWRTMGDLRPGDRVFDEQGMIRHVVARQRWTQRPCYEVAFGDGESIVADENHQWLTHDFRYRCQGRGGPRIVTTAEMASTTKATKSGTSNHAIPLAGAVQYVAQNLLVDPYVLGYWLGDGSKGSGRIITADEQVAQLFADRGYPCERGERWAVDRAWRVKGLAADLRRLGVLDHKHVPLQYLRGSIEQRFELLRGLMDSDGTVTRQGQCVFANTDPLLVAATLELIRTLGIRATSTVRRQAGHQSFGAIGLLITSRRDVWHVQFATHHPVFGLTRKAERLRPDNVRRRYHMVKSVRAAATQDTVCIEVDSPSHLFLIGRGFVATHNSLLRPAYKHWLIKDRLLRVQAQTIERNGMGVPLYKGQEDASAEDLAAGKAMATAWRAGEAAGSAVPHGADLILRGVEGDLPDADPAIRYHDEQIARAVLAHFLNLGTQTGSWALGTTFADFFTLSLQTLAQQIADTATQHIVEDIVDANFGEEEPAPRLVFDEIGSRQAATAQALKALIDAGVIHPDQVLEESSRQQYGLPPQDPATTTTPPPSDGGGDGAPKAVAAAAAHDTDDELDDGGCAEADIDEWTLALITAMVELDGIRAAFDPAKHPRIPKGQPGGGRFLSMVERVKAKVREYLDGNGDGDPFEGFNREQLRKAARMRGIELKRGASRDDISQALLADLGAHIKAPPPTTSTSKGAAVPAGAEPYHPTIDGVADLARAVEKGRIVNDRELAGGAIGAVHLRTYEDGTQVVYKRVAKAGTSDKSVADSEQLGALVARQLGLAAPRVYRNGVDELHMEYAANAVIAEDHQETVRRSAHNSHEGYMLGLLDVLTDQADRHDGNWMITDAGHLVPIDNGGWWPEYDDAYYTPQEAPSLQSPFSAILITESTIPFSATGEWKDNDFSRADIAAIRKRLSSLKPHFEHLGRKEWFDYTMARLDEVEKHATGTTSRLLPVQ